MRTNRLTLALLWLVIVPAQGADLDAVAGTWRFPTTGVYIVISDTGDTYQCRIAIDGTVFEAPGKFRNSGAIEWAPIEARANDGEPFDLSSFGDNFSWGKDLVSISERELILSGSFGEYTYVRYEGALDCRCRAGKIEAKVGGASLMADCGGESES